MVVLLHIPIIRIGVLQGAITCAGRRPSLGTRYRSLGAVFAIRMGGANGRRGLGLHADGQRDAPHDVGLYRRAA